MSKRQIFQITPWHKALEIYSPLNHKVRNDSVKLGTFVVKRLACLSNPLLIFEIDDNEKH